MKTEWIDDAAALKSFCQKVGKGSVAVDTESDHFHAYQAQVCLIQVATDEVSALIDPLALDKKELAPLFEIFEDQTVTKVFHAGRNDIIEIDRDYGVGIANLFDTQIAARFLDYERNSLSWMLEELLDVDTGGNYQRFDWTTRPLPEPVMRYAADDVHHLLALQKRFSGELQTKGWFDAFAQQCQLVATTVEHQPKPFDPEGWRKIKGSRKLDGRGRAAIQELYLWRHQLCTRLNQSAVIVFPNGALVRLAKKRPETVGEVRGIRRLSDDLKATHADAIAEAIVRSLSADIPVEKRRRRSSERSQTPEQMASYDALRRWRNKRSKKLGIPSEFIATNAVVAKIAEAMPTNLKELNEVEEILDWHCELLGEEMLAIIGRARANS